LAILFVLAGSSGERCTRPADHVIDKGFTLERVARAPE
jgi:hypothetical protein